MTGDGDGNGVFKGTVTTQIESLCGEVGDLRAEFKALREKVESMLVGTARLRSQVSVLWGAAGFLAATCAALVLRVILQGGAP